MTLAARERSILVRTNTSKPGLYNFYQYYFYQCKPHREANPPPSTRVVLSRLRDRKPSPESLSHAIHPGRLAYPALQ